LAITDNNSQYQRFSYHNNHSPASPHHENINIRENCASQFPSPGGQHLATRRRIAENPRNGSGGMSRLAGLQRRQAVSRNFQKSDRTQHNSKMHIPIIQYSTKTYNYHQNTK